MACHLSAYLHPRLSFQNYFCLPHKKANSRPATLPLCCRQPGLATARSPGPTGKTPLKTQASRVGVGTTAHNEGPSECSSEFLKSQLLECEARATSSLGAKCVCHYSRSLVRAAASVLSGERRLIRTNCRSHPRASSTQVIRSELSGTLRAVTLRPHAPLLVLQPPPPL